MTAALVPVTFGVFPNLKLGRQLLRAIHEKMQQSLHLRRRRKLVKGGKILRGKTLLQLVQKVLLAIIPHHFRVGTFQGGEFYGVGQVVVVGAGVAQVVVVENVEDGELKREFPCGGESHAASGFLLVSRPPVLKPDLEIET